MDERIHNLAVEMIRHSIWATASVEVEPEVRLTNWQVYAVGSGRHFVGFNPGWQEGRVSTAVQSFDPQTRRGSTASGRIYELVGPPGCHPDAEWVFGLWLAAQQLSHEDVIAVPPEIILAGE
jgi:hypothetical protein